MSNSRTRSNAIPLYHLLDSAEALQIMSDRLSDVLNAPDPSPEIWKEMCKAWDELKAAGRTRNVRRQQLAAAKLDTLMSEAIGGGTQWKEAYKIIEQTDKMRDRALRRAMVEGTYVKLQDVRAVMHNWISAIRIVVQKTLIESGHPELARDIIGLVAAEYEAVCGVLPDIAERQSPKQREKELKQLNDKKKKQSTRK